MTFQTLILCFMALDSHHLHSITNKEKHFWTNTAVRGDTKWWHLKSPNRTFPKSVGFIFLYLPDKELVENIWEEEARLDFLFFIFLLPIEPVSDSFLLVGWVKPVGRKAKNKNKKITLRQVLIAVLCSSFNAKMPPRSDKTAPAAASAHISNSS